MGTECKFCKMTIDDDEKRVFIENAGVEYNGCYHTSCVEESELVEKLALVNIYRGNVDG